MSTPMLPRTRRLTRALLALALVALFAAPAAAQFDSAQMSGFVKDAQGQMVPGASVRILNEAGVQEKDGEGYYIREGIVVVPKNGVLRDGVVI